MLSSSLSCKDYTLQIHIYIPAEGTATLPVEKKILKKATHEYQQKNQLIRSSQIWVCGKEDAIHWFLERNQLVSPGPGALFLANTLLNPISAGVLENQDMTNDTSLESSCALLLELQICKNWFFYRKIQLYSKNVCKKQFVQQMKNYTFLKSP